MESNMALQTIQQYYTQTGLLSNAGKYAPHLEDLPEDLGELCRIVQGLMVHIFWASRYGLNLSEERKSEVQIRSIPRKLDRLFELDDHPLNQPRSLEKKLVGNCRDFSLFMVSILQHQGVPARARCGFGTYFRPNHYEDHWICEYWNSSAERWVMIDAQLDPFQCEKLKIGFDPLDLPDGAFITGGYAWRMCRSGLEDANKFGIFDMKGLWFIQGDLIRDFLALNKIEILPWDAWGYISGPQIIDADLPALDKIAELTVAGNAVFEEIRSMYQKDVRLQPAPDWQP